jgi:hypothetical protein
MKRPLILGLLVVVNVALVGLLVSAPKKPSVQRPASSAADVEAPFPSSNFRSAVQDTLANRRAVSSNAPAPVTPFAAVYSPDSKQFVVNLRGIHCPEETVKDIVLAEISRRYQAQEDALRPKPADHVPFGWSPKTSEGKLLRRRQQAASLAREKASLLREALGYDVPVPMPTYGMAASEQRFEDSLATLSPENSSAARRVQESYWEKVQSLRDRTKGYWQSDDVAELERLKQERQQALRTISNGP